MRLWSVWIAAQICTSPQVTTCQGTGAYPAGEDLYCDADASLPQIYGIVEVNSGVAPPKGSPSLPNFQNDCSSDPDCSAGTGLYCRSDANPHFCAVFAPQSCF